MASITPVGVESQSISVTDHARKRYWERIPESNDMQGPQVDSIIRQRVADATFIFYGNCGNSQEANFYVHDDMVFVIKDSAVITLYRADYGFGDDVDGLVRRRLLSMVKGLQGRIQRANDGIRDMQSKIDIEINTIEDRLRVLVAEVKLLEDARATLYAKRKEAQSEKGLLEARLLEEGTKLIQSKRYNTELLAAMRAVAEKPVNGKGK